MLINGAFESESPLTFPGEIYRYVDVSNPEIIAVVMSHRADDKITVSLADLEANAVIGVFLFPPHMAKEAHAKAQQLTNYSPNAEIGIES